MADLMLRLECSGRRIVVLAGPGDRRDEDIKAMARIAAKAFDFIILRRDDDLRGRGPDEVPKMMAAELALAGMPESKFQMIPDEQTAIDTALQMAKRGDLLLIFADKVSRGWKQVIYFKPEHKSVPPSAPTEPAQVSPSGTVRLPEIATREMIEGAEVIQDERGVRLAREQDD
jgi:cyanophycin synthetase